ncbi:MAG TPA: GNAT family N-acetyltransferase [Burkholderiales bacterium]|nr:GNAT family N-acetyltransferase [Burkholderiales bacterium]
MTFRVVTVTDAQGAVVEPQWLARAEAVHRSLRTALPADYAGKLARVFAGGGRMCVAAEGDRVVGLAVYRISENTFAGRFLYVDDLVTDEGERSRGVGHLLMAHLERVARHAGCDNLALDSATHRHRAHRFYFREGMVITSFNFRKALA